MPRRSRPSWLLLDCPTTAYTQSETHSMNTNVSFHAPPGWPPCPPHWVPGRDWAPKPEWGPAPAGWSFYRTRAGSPASPPSGAWVPLATEHEAESAKSGAQSKPNGRLLALFVAGLVAALSIGAAAVLPGERDESMGAGEAAEPLATVSVSAEPVTTPSATETPLGPPEATATPEPSDTPTMASRWATSPAPPPAPAALEYGMCITLSGPPDDVTYGVEPCETYEAATYMVTGVVANAGECSDDFWLTVSEHQKTYCLIHHFNQGFCYRPDDYGRLELGCNENDPESFIVWDAFPGTEQECPDTNTQRVVHPDPPVTYCLWYTDSPEPQPKQAVPQPGRQPPPMAQSQTSTVVVPNLVGSNAKDAQQWAMRNRINLHLATEIRYEFSISCRVQGFAMILRQNPVGGSTVQLPSAGRLNITAYTDC